MKIQHWIILGIFITSGALVSCEKKTEGAQEQQNQPITCYQCFKPGHFKFAVQPNVINRTVCNQDSYNDLLADGYQCRVI